jgi:adenylate kinase family enzyme
MVLMISRGICKAQGWVMDGYPQTLSQAEALERAGLVPHVIVEIDMGHTEMVRRTNEDYKFDLLYVL